MKSDELRAMQAPFKNQYKETPYAAVITLTADGTLGDEGVTCSVETGRAMVEAARRYGCVFQTGSQQRSEYGGRFQAAVEHVSPLRGVVGEGEGARIAALPRRGRDVHHGVEVRRELRLRGRQGLRVGVVDHDRAAVGDVELLGEHLEFLPAGCCENDVVAGLGEVLRDRASEIGVATGDQHIHGRCLLSPAARGVLGGW